MSFGPGARTRKNFRGVHSGIVDAVELAYTYTTVDFGVLNGGGLRSSFEAAANKAAGTGIIKSRHLTGDAIDLVPYVDGRYQWVRSYCEQVNHAMFRACDELLLPIQNGADWDMDSVFGEDGEWDWVHFQNPWPYRMKRAIEAMNARIIAREGLG